MWGFRVRHAYWFIEDRHWRFWFCCNKPIIKRDIEKLEEKLIPYLEKYFLTNNEEELILKLSNDDLEDIKLIAETKIKVQTGIRWQVFKRDNWKCLSCGRSAKENIILHIDHIIPRSKGGNDNIDNYQTLCETCNIGKSNKDETDLRKNITL